MRTLLSLCLLTVQFHLLSAQTTTLPFPRNFEPAYEKGFRNWDGNPGEHYWQNHSDYTINVEFYPKNHKLKGAATITYHNQSPDSLRMIRLKLLHDLYRKGEPHIDAIDPNDLKDGVEIEKISLNGIPVGQADRYRHDTYLDLSLKSALPPHTSLQLFIQWSFTMPADKKATRECVCDESTFFIPYFYPEIAVFDDLHGWASAPYNGLQEFYHDFSNFDVTITLPKNYQVWATGEWQNAADVLQPNYLDRWQKAHQSTEIIPIFSEAELKSGSVFKKNDKNVFQFTAKSVPDFAFAASDHYNWDATSVIVDEKFGRRAFISAVYDASSKDFKRVAQITANALHLMSNWMPGYPYPYPCMTVFNGNDAMEYPMMINDASTTEDDVAYLTVHEASHTYFPFMMGINEQYYAWMDEGWANFFEHTVADSIENKSSGIPRAWGFGNDWEVPPMVPSRALDKQSYSFASYARPHWAYTQLYDLLGYEKFHDCMVAYMDRWKGKHPGPYDFFNTFNQASGKNLDWFWKPWFFEFGYPDLSMSVSKMDHATDSPNYVVYILKKGLLPVPVKLQIEYTDGTKDTLYKSAVVWSDPAKTTLQLTLQSGKTPKKITLGDKKVPDVKPKDNFWPPQ